MFEPVTLGYEGKITVYDYEGNTILITGKVIKVWLLGMFPVLKIRLPNGDERIYTYSSEPYLDTYLSVESQSHRTGSAT